MADPRFFVNKGPFSVQQLLSLVDEGADIRGDGTLEVVDVAPLSEAGPQDISFLDNRKYISAFEESGAGACIVAPEFADRAPKGMTLILTTRPYRAYARVAHAFYQSATQSSGIHPAAFVDPGAELADGVSVGPGAVVEADAKLDNDVEIGAGAIVGHGVSIGAATRIGANASVEYCDIGARCEIHPGVRLGTRGFGFDMSAEGHLDVPQLGRVILGNDVEVGANSTIDRGAGPDTVIGDGCKIDNLVQIGHNVRMGQGCVVVAQAGVAGSTELQDFVVLAAQSGVAGHLTIAPGTQLAARSGIMRNTEMGDKLAGNPAIPAKEFFRQTAVLAKLTKDRNRKD
ncbi:MAG: UDP-3-O-(3-hydroxymyristoyl)glucosamine N-acyltransferase [Alphaproteobacteria bacterium]|jgi:UDP-3-O-[3-hydroxymyristoyl] glucosamine N-acyltransferase|nr:UDP-3-O-(3-hydroxymyristoyl)glucosamine N-acyltransferase [Alphaproteobacteria bacterium]